MTGLMIVIPPLGLLGSLGDYVPGPVGVEGLLFPGEFWTTVYATILSTRLGEDFKT